ncbi:MAG: MoaD/ThiS family protein [Ignavibacteriaceae bacterium]|nr:MoaD/ThiS family protein [Ignavibacteriaceae bacterium]
MKVKIELLGLLHIKGVANNSFIEIQEGSTISDIYNELKILRDHQNFIIPFINGNEVRKSAEVNEGDTVKIFLPTGGG